MAIDANLQNNCRIIEKLMCQGLKAVCPDVRVGAEGALMYKWYKEAEPIRDENGDLMIWTPELAAKLKAEKKMKEYEEKIDMDAEYLEEIIGGISAA